MLEPKDLDMPVVDITEEALCFSKLTWKYLG